VLLDCGHIGRKAEDFASDLLRRQGVAFALAAGFALRRGDSGFVADTGSKQLLRLAFCGAPERVAEGAKPIAASVGSW
jgi:aspartate/methionine/tyrosine aminotransferase